MPESPVQMKILVVDDEPDLELLIRQKFRRRIRSQELEFVFAGDGFEALERLDEVAGVDIVLTDINMPRMDGLTLLNRLREVERDLKVVIVSAYGDLENIRTAMNRGAFDFITKPINFDDLEVTIQKTHGELQMLRKAFGLQQQLSAIQRELEIASQIQLSTLPSTFPAFPARKEFDIYATMIPAQEVGGDFYDFFLIDDRRLGFTLGDVSGKGIGAALFMAISRTMLRATGLQGLDVDACITHLNRVLYPETMPRMFVTLVYGILDTETGEVTYCSAGHDTPILLRKTGEVSSLERTGGLGLCLKAGFQYTSRKVRLDPGDMLFLFSDGVTEAVDDERERYSESRLAACLGRADGGGPAEVVRDVLRAVTDFSGGIDQSDDITMLALQYRGIA
jgi:phosphoserine phosphatase RsbU/P